MLKKINATGNPGCTLFNSECTISAKNTLRIGPDCRLVTKITVSHYVFCEVHTETYKHVVSTCVKHVLR